MIVNNNLIGSRFSECSFENFIALKGNEHAIRACKKFVSKEINGLVLIGAPGMGKTHLTIATIKLLDHKIEYNIKDDIVEIKERESKIAYFPQYDLVRSMRADALSGSRETLNHCINSDVLAIDDLGVGGDNTAFIVESFEYIIDSRYKNMVPTIITTNLSLNEISRVFSPRIVSRFVEAYSVVEINTGSDYRLKKAVDKNGS